MSSPIYAARQWLHDQLVASADLSGVQVTYGAPQYSQTHEMVALGGVTSINEEDRVLGGNRVEREFSLQVHFFAYTGGSDVEALDERGFSFHEAIRAVVYADRTLGGTVRLALAEGLDTDGVAPVEGGGHSIYGLVTIRCAVRTV